MNDLWDIYGIYSNISLRKETQTSFNWCSRNLFSLSSRSRSNSSLIWCLFPDAAQGNRRLLMARVIYCLWSSALIVCCLVVKNSNNLIDKLMQIWSLRRTACNWYFFRELISHSLAEKHRASISVVRQIICLCSLNWELSLRIQRCEHLVG